LALPYVSRRLWAAEGGAPLPIPPLVETGSDPVTLEAIAGNSQFLSGAKTPTMGYSQPYLGPVLRMRRGSSPRMRVVNRLSEPVTAHWHGLHVPAVVDGGPKIEIAPGKTWQPDLPVDQPAATLWYHSHVHNQTAEQVYHGLSGLIIVDDPDAPDPGLPKTYGVDDIAMVIQDRAFGSDGALLYSKRRHDQIHGFRAGTILVNGAIRPTASVPAGLVRLRLLNGSNARIYHLRFADDRTFHQVASDAGLLPKPVALTSVTLAPAERIEIVADFKDGQPVALLSGPDRNGQMGGMMRGHSPAPPAPAGEGREGEFKILGFAPDKQKPTAVTQLPDTFPGAPKPDLGEPVRTRSLQLDMGGGRGMMGRGGRGGGRMGGGGMGGGRMGGGGMGGGGMRGPHRRGGPAAFLAINGRSYSPDRVDLELRRGETELWEVSASMMAHPFHVHGTAFQVLTSNGDKVPYETTGLKDTFLVEGQAQILLRVDRPAAESIPFLYHCHILEHEDAGMMGQFTVI